MSNSLLWYTTRGAGAVSLVLLSAVVVLGILSVLRVQTAGWPRFLTAVMSKPVERRGESRWSRLSSIPEPDREEVLRAGRQLTDAVYEGLDVTSEIRAVATQKLGQTVLVWARWILIGTGLLLSFWAPTDLTMLQVQLAAIIALAFGNFYLHVQLLRGHPALDAVVYGASLGDICVVTALVLVQGGYASPVFIFYFAAIVGISVAFPTFMTAGYTAIVVGIYGIICLATAPADGHPAVFTRLLMIAAVAVCGNLFARHEQQRRADAIRIHHELLDEIEQGAPSAKPQPAAPAS